MSEPEYRDPVRLDLPSASGMEITVACPGSVRLKASLPPEASLIKNEQEDEWKASGTRIHKAAETGNTLELDADEAEIYRQGLKYEEEIVEKWLQDKALDDCVEGPREMRVWLHDPLKWPDLLGSVQLDRHYYNKERGCVLSVDWKSGFNPNLSPSPRSWQLRFGVVALWREEYGDWMKEARVAHCKAQQKCTVNDFCDYAEIDLQYSWDSIRYHLWESTQPDAQFRPGPHCNWCPCKAWCVYAGAYSMMPTVIARRVTQSEMMTWDMMIERMEPEDLLKIWENSTVIRKILDAVTGRLKTFTPEALNLLGLERGKGRKLDPITNIAEAFDFLCTVFPREQVLACMEFGKGKLVDLVRQHKDKNKEEASTWVDTSLDAWITRKCSEAPLKRAKDTILI